MIALRIVRSNFYDCGLILAILTLVIAAIVGYLDHRKSASRGSDSRATRKRCYLAIFVAAPTTLFAASPIGHLEQEIMCGAMFIGAVAAACWFWDGLPSAKPDAPTQLAKNMRLYTAYNGMLISAFLLETGTFWLPLDRGPTVRHPVMTPLAGVTIRVALVLFVLCGVLTAVYGRKAFRRPTAVAAFPPDESMGEDAADADTVVGS